MKNAVFTDFEPFYQYYAAIRKQSIFSGIFWMVSGMAALPLKHRRAFFSAVFQSRSF